MCWVKDTRRGVQFVKFTPASQFRRGFAPFFLRSRVRIGDSTPLGAVSDDLRQVSAPLLDAIPLHFLRTVLILEKGGPFIDNFIRYIYFSKAS